MVRPLVAAAVAVALSANVIARVLLVALIMVRRDIFESIVPPHSAVGGLMAV
jgi:hypothetical protein